MLVGLNLDQFSINCFSPGLTSEYLKARSSWAHLSLKGKDGRAPWTPRRTPFRGQHTELMLSLGSDLATPWEELRPGLDPGALSAGHQGFPSLGGEEKERKGRFPSAVCGCGTMATFQPPCRLLATAAS